MTHKMSSAMIVWFIMCGQRRIYGIIDYKNATIKNDPMFSFYRWGNGKGEEMMANWSLIECTKVNSDYITHLFNIA
jgi:hypothetical protein